MELPATLAVCDGSGRNARSGLGHQFVPEEFRRDSHPALCTTINEGWVVVRLPLPYRSIVSASNRVTARVSGVRYLDDVPSAQSVEKEAPIGRCIA